ncbi:MAG: CoA-binding protein [Anaerolineales bacterium]|nr:CoA-binding protein [Anaerolineales bacterium]
MNNSRLAFTALDQIFHAKSVAIVGASSNPKKFGYMTLETLVTAGYQGDIYPINPKAESILGLKAYPSLRSVPYSVELAVIIVPAPFVPKVMREAASIGVKGSVILSAGYRESGFPEREVEIAAIAQETGLRFLGPNIQGINYVPNKLCAMFFPVITLQGPLAIVSQSGTVTAALSQWAEDDGLGISAAVNLGNQTDMGVSEVLEYLAEDEPTKAIALYLEGLRDGRQFLKVAGRVARYKPVAVLKGGRSAAGQASVASHTGSLAGRDEVFSAACRQVGLIRAGDLEGLFDAAKGLATLPDIKGRRVLVVSTSGGGNTLAVDEAEKQGLVIPKLPEPFTTELEQLGLPPNAGIDNPLDLASLSPEHFVQAITLADKYDAADLYLIILGDPVEGSVEAIRVLADKVRGGLAVTYFGGGALEKKDGVVIQRLGIPVFSSPERAALGMAAALQASEQRKKLS